MAPAMLMLTSMNSDAMTSIACAKPQPVRPSRGSEMQWLIVDRASFRVLGAAYDMRDARTMMPANSMIRNLHTGAIVALKA